MQLQVHLYNERVIPHYLINGAKAATRKHSFKSSTINGREKGGKKKRNCGRAHAERRKR